MPQQKIIIVGAGIIGLATAYSLLKQGMQDVTVLEQARVDHERSSSHGLSRLLRFEYGDDAFYSKMVSLSQRRWHQLEQVSGERLYTQTGMLLLGSEGDHFSRPSYHTLHCLGHSLESLTRNACTQRFPQFNAQDYDIFIYNEQGGMLHASHILKTLKKCILNLGGKILEGLRVARIRNERTLSSIHLQIAGDHELVADRVVVATGPWVHQLLRDLALPVRLTRQHLLYFANLPPSQFGLFTFPAFMADDLYGFPIYNTCTGGAGPAWLKVASHAFGPPADPNEPPEPVDQHRVHKTVEHLCHLLPALREAALVRVESHIYDVSEDEHFILDYLPDDPRITFASGLTGHAFKFGPLLGDVMSSLVCETEPAVPLDRFRLARFSHQLHHSLIC